MSPCPVLQQSLGSRPRFMFFGDTKVQQRIQHSSDARTSSNTARDWNMLARYMSIQYLVVSMELWKVVCTIKAFVAVCFARKSERPMLNTIIRTSNSEHPIPRHNRICLVRSPMRSLVPAEPGFFRSASSRACSSGLHAWHAFACLSSVPTTHSWHAFACLSSVPTTHS